MAYLINSLGNNSVTINNLYHCINYSENIYYF